MKIAVLHLSDFHVKASDRFLETKMNGLLSALNVLKGIDDYAIVFTGDLADSGQINEYRRARFLLNKILNGVKNKNNNNFVNVFVIPGNHDLCLPKDARERKYIQEHYERGAIETLINEESKYLENFYLYSNSNGRIPYDILLTKRFCSFGDYKIQFNLINTALFSTLEPNDKELHYFPSEKMYLLEKADDANLNITVMHHSYEWFHWNYKSDLEKTIINNSEFLLYGHDHREQATTISIDNSLDTWVSSAGEMKFTDETFVDSFNVIVIDTETNCFDGYKFNWDCKSKIYAHKLLSEKKSLQSHMSKLMPLPNFVKELKVDAYNLSDDFTKYFVFPKLVAESKNEFGKYETITTVEELKNIIGEKKKIVISGATNAGKTTLLKYMYCYLLKDKVPLYFSVDNKTRINTKNFIKRIFEEQYGEEPALFEKYEQLDNDRKVLILDGWDVMKASKAKNELLQKINESFEYVIVSANAQQTSVIDAIKEELIESSNFYEFHIKPFFTEKRNELVRNICVQKNSYNDVEINNVNRLIDSLVQNNSGLFALNPAFIIRYTNYFIQDPYHDYTKGEAVFSKVFEFELNRSIMAMAKKKDVDEIFTAFEEIAGYMYLNKKDILPIEEVRSVISEYNSSYGVEVNVKTIIEVGINAKIFKQMEDLSTYFYNKNHFAYFVAKYLIRAAQNEPADNTGMEYALRNICFGINSDVIMFVSYLLNNTKMIMSIAEYAGELLEPWKALDFHEKNIALLHYLPTSDVKSPTEEEKKNYEETKEKSEETHYQEDVVEAKGLFEYNDEDIDKYPYRLIRAIKYTEMMCKALPAFNSSLKVEQKKKLIESIYMYPRKIVYAMLRPLDYNAEFLCKDIMKFIDENDIKKKNGSKYTEKDVKEMLNDNARATMLSYFNHFAEFSTNTKSVKLLVDKEITDISENIMRLMIIENSNNTDLLLKEADGFLKKHKGSEYSIMAKLIVRKHLLTNKELPFDKKQQICDKVFGKAARKDLLLSR